MGFEESVRRRPAYEKICRRYFTKSLPRPAFEKQGNMIGVSAYINSLKRTVCHDLIHFRSVTEHSSRSCARPNMFALQTSQSKALYTTGVPHASVIPTVLVCT
jgi:hypothetical protein